MVIFAFSQLIELERSALRQFEDFFDVVKICFVFRSVLASPYEGVFVRRSVCRFKTSLFEYAKPRFRLRQMHTGGGW